MDYWRNQGYNALHYEQEPFENAVQERQWAAYEQVEIAAAVATRRTAAQMTSSFRDTTTERSLSEITSECAQALEAQRPSGIHEAAAEVLPQLRRASTIPNRVEKNIGTINCTRRTVEESHQKLLVYKLEQRNDPPESRRCEVKRQSYKHSC